MSNSLPQRIRNLGDKQWLALLARSIDHSRIDDIDFPGFPSVELQATFVGSSNKATLKEAFSFYVLVKKYAQRLGVPLTEQSHFLDFGCGWGRFLRFFWKDVGEANLYGCDVNAGIVQTCLSLNVPGQIDLIDPRGTLSYPDGFFDSMIAYSVFTHLPESIHLHWMRELARVTRPGGVFCLTIEPRRFIDFIAKIPTATAIDWYKRLSSFKPQIADFYRMYDSGNLVFMPTNEGVEETYGDAVVPLSYIRREWAPYFKVVDYIDNPRKFWQVVLVVQRV